MAARNVYKVSTYKYIFWGNNYELKCFVSVIVLSFSLLIISETLRGWVLLLVSQAGSFSFQMFSVLFKKVKKDDSKRAEDLLHPVLKNIFKASSEKSAIVQMKKKEHETKSFKSHCNLVSSLVTPVEVSDKDSFSSKLAAEAVPLIIASSIQPSTAKKYNKEFNDFATWANENGRVFNLPTVETILIYLVWVLNKTNSVSKVLSVRSSLSFYVNQMMRSGEANVLEDRRIKALMAGISKSFSAPVKKKSGLTVPIVLAALQHLQKKKSVLNMRTSAFLAIQFFLTARYEEVKRLLKSSIQVQGSGDLKFTFQYAKNNQLHENKLSVMKSIPDLEEINPTEIVRNYIIKLESVPGKTNLLFPALKNKVNRDGSCETVLDPEEKAVSYNACYKEYKKIYQELKLDVDLTELTGTHAPRIGSVVEAVKNPDVTLFDVQHGGRWVSSETPLLYMRQVRGAEGKMSGILGQNMANCLTKFKK